ncbi:MAG: hypothetical protein K2O09_07960 [Treponemataceae bacterium]|nr:hypothetical protein [Treponemataceae bacterium]
MIQTYNETDVHRTLKHLYALEYNGTTEVPTGNWICDIVTETGDVIEIQTTNISKLTPKTQNLLTAGKKVTIVRPIVAEKTIETYAPDGALVSRRKSPKKQTIYAILRDLTGIYPLLLHPHFMLEVPFITITEQRRKTATPVQLANKSRRFLKDWIPQEKKLTAIIRKERYQTKADYLTLIPPALPVEFTATELQNAIFTKIHAHEANKSTCSAAASQARLLLWLFTRMNLVQKCGKKGRSTLYNLQTD